MLISTDGRLPTNGRHRVDPALSAFDRCDCFG